MNLFHRFWPELVRTEGFLRNFATPLIKVRRRNEEQAFFTTDGASSALGPLSRRDAAVCQRTNLSLASASPGLHAAPLQSIIGGGRPRRRPAHGRSSMGHASHRLRALARLTARARPPPRPGTVDVPCGRPWHRRYYKGLGTSTAAEARAYFTMLTQHMSAFQYTGAGDDRAFHLAFDKDRADERKQWMLDFRCVWRALRTTPLGGRGGGRSLQRFERRYADGRLARGVGCPSRLPLAQRPWGAGPCGGIVSAGCDGRGGASHADASEPGYHPVLGLFRHRLYPVFARGHGAVHPVRGGWPEALAAQGAVRVL